MSEPLTLEDIYKLFEKTDKQLDRTNEQLDRTNEQLDRTNEQLDRTNEQLERSSREFDRRLAEDEEKFDRRFAKLERTVAETTKAVGNLTTRWGRFVEELVEPAAIRMFRARGIDVKETHTRSRVRRQGIAMEIDILAVDETELVLVECKSRLSREDVVYFLEKLARFKEAFPHYKDYHAYGAVAGIEVDEGVDRYAYKQGLFVIKPSGDTVDIINDEVFQAKTW